MPIFTLMEAYHTTADHLPMAGRACGSMCVLRVAYLATQHHELAGSFTEIESGRNSDRPQLTAALAQARRQKATVVIAKLDRLARSVAFISAIMESGVEFIAADMPAANRLTIQIMAVIAENEARMISERTKAALAAAKARGVVLGNRASLIAAQPIAREVIVKQADRHADNVMPTLKQIVKSGVRSVHLVAEQLNYRGVKLQGAANGMVPLF